MAYDRRALVGVGGWLAFFIITLCLNAIAAVLVPIGIASGMDAPVTPSGIAWTAYIAIAVLLGLAKAVTYGFMAWRLNTRQQADTPPLVIKLLWAAILLPPLVDALAGMVLLGLTASDAAGSIAVGIVRPLIYGAVWTAYLLRSERVVNTYSGHPETDRLSAVFD